MLVVARRADRGGVRRSGKADDAVGARSLAIAARAQIRVGARLSGRDRGRACSARHRRRVGRRARVALREETDAAGALLIFGAARSVAQGAGRREGAARKLAFGVAGRGFQIRCARIQLRRRIGNSRERIFRDAGGGAAFDLVCVVVARACCSERLTATLCERRRCVRDARTCAREPAARRRRRIGRRATRPQRHEAQAQTRNRAKNTPLHDCRPVQSTCSSRRARNRPCFALRTKFAMTRTPVLSRRVPRRFSCRLRGAACRRRPRSSRSRRRFGRSRCRRTLGRPR